MRKGVVFSPRLLGDQASAKPSIHYVWRVFHFPNSPKNAHTPSTMVNYSVNSFTIAKVFTKVAARYWWLVICLDFFWWFLCKGFTVFNQQGIRCNDFFASIVNLPSQNLGKLVRFGGRYETRWCVVWNIHDCMLIGVYLRIVICLALVLRMVSKPPLESGFHS